MQHAVSHARIGMVQQPFAQMLDCDLAQCAPLTTRGLSTKTNVDLLLAKPKRMIKTCSLSQVETLLLLSHFGEKANGVENFCVPCDLDSLCSLAWALQGAWKQWPFFLQRFANDMPSAHIVICTKISNLENLFSSLSKHLGFEHCRIRCKELEQW